MPVKYIATTIYKSVFLIALAVFCSTHVMAQGPGTPGDEMDIEDYDPDNSVPIDGGASILVAAGVAYGLKKIYDKRKEKSAENID